MVREAAVARPIAHSPQAPGCSHRPRTVTPASGRAGAEAVTGRCLPACGGFDKRDARQRAGGAERGAAAGQARVPCRPSMSTLEAIVLGIVQGLTEFLPISSTAHVRIVPAMCGWPDPGAAFTAVTQLGTESAVLAYFRRDIATIATTWAPTTSFEESPRVAGVSPDVSETLMRARS